MEACVNVVEDQAVQVEYKNFNAFETNIVAAATRAYNLGFGDCKKVTDAFPNLDLHQVTSMGELEEDKEEGREEDEEDKGGEPMQVGNEDDIGEEVVEIPTPEVPEVAEASTGISSTTTP